MTDHLLYLIVDRCLCPAHRQARSIARYPVTRAMADEIEDAASINEELPE